MKTAIGFVVACKRRMKRQPRRDNPVKDDTF
jgi:hypothetical protein